MQPSNKHHPLINESITDKISTAVQRHFYLPINTVLKCSNAALIQKFTQKKWCQ